MTELLHWLVLHHALHKTPRRARLLIETQGTPAAVIDALKRPEQMLKITKIQKLRLQDLNWPLATADLKWQQHPNHHIITLADPHYPLLLKETYDPPLLLYIMGDPTLLNAAQIAIVGSRNPTNNGRDNAFQFAAALSQNNLIVTSGLAIGVDGAAHKGALSVKQPTIAVLGSGLNQLYPKRHRALFEQITQHGAAVSEFPLEQAAEASNFPRRNRIISGLSMATLVVEARPKSGSLITARFALEQNRDVFAIPGSIHNPLTRGCHMLIKNGAKLVETIEDICDELKLNTVFQTKLTTHLPTKELDQTDIMLLECLGFETSNIQDIISCLDISPQNAASRLLNLELHGYIKAVPGGYERAIR